MSRKPVTTIAPGGDKPGPQAVQTEEARLAADLQHLNDLLERDAVEAARRYIKELEQRWPDSERERLNRQTRADAYAGVSCCRCGGAAHQRPDDRAWRATGHQRVSATAT